MVPTRLALLAATLASVLAAVGCSSKKPSGNTADRDEPLTHDEPMTRTPPAPNAARVIYLLTREEVLYAFDPTIPGLPAYQQLMKIDCHQVDKPQSMAIDRKGDAWVIHRSGALFRVNLADGSCRPLNVSLPPGQFGMAFTSVAAGSNDEKLYVMHSGTGLYTVDPTTMILTSSGFGTRGELTGGGDAKLFHFDPRARLISEVDLAGKSIHTVRALTSMPPSFGAYAFARYAGSFFLFTSPSGGVPSQTIVYDPVRQVEKVRDANIGVEIVGAGQSTLTPTSDTLGTVSGTFPDEGRD